MKKFPKVLEFGALQSLYSNPNTGRDVLQAAFCKTISLNADVEYLHSKGTEIIKCCNIWKKNWETVLKNIAPDVERRRTEKLDATAEKFKDYTPDQLNNLVEAIKKLQSKDSVEKTTEE